LLIKQALPGSFVFDFEDTAGRDAEGSVYGAPMAIHRRRPGELAERLMAHDA